MDSLITKKSKQFGYELIVNLESCNNFVLHQPFIKKFVIKLCDDILKMKRYGDLQLTHFGETGLEGWTLIQLITTSNITAHFMDESRNAYINIFSCKEFNSDEVIDFIEEFFEPEDMNYTLIVR
jgi:S-adenosylmethionine decarboxylase